MTGARTIDGLVATGELTPEEARLALGGKKKPSKYGAVRCELDSHKFDSKREMQRYCVLSLMQKAGEIRNLFVHPSFPIKIGETVVCVVELDFAYTDAKTGKQRVEDVKGKDNALSRLKRRLLEASFPHLAPVEIVT